MGNKGDNPVDALTSAVADPVLDLFLDPHTGDLLVNRLAIYVLSIIFAVLLAKLLFGSSSSSNKEPDAAAAGGPNARGKKAGAKAKAKGHPSQKPDEATATKGSSSAASATGSGAAAGAGAGHSIKVASRRFNSRKKPAVPNHPEFARLIKGHSSDITCFAYSSDGKYVATADMDGLIRVVFRSTLGESNAKVHRIEVPRDYPTAMAFTPDSKFLVVALRLTRNLSFYSISSKVSNHPEMKSTFETNQGSEIVSCPAAAFAFLPASVFVATLGKDRDTTISFFSPRGVLLARVNTHQVENYSLAVSKDGRFFTVGAWQSEAKIWHLEQAAGSLSKATKVMSLHGHSGHITGVEFSPNSEIAYTSSLDGTWRAWNINVRFEVQEDPRLIEAHTVSGPIRMMKLSQDGKMMALLLDDGNVIFVDTESGAELGSLPMNEFGTVYRMELLNDAKVLGVLFEHRQTLTEWKTPRSSE